MDLWREIVDSLSDAMVVLSPMLEPIAVNAAAETMLGASRISRTLVGKIIRRNEWLAAMIDSCLNSGQNLDNPEATLIIDRHSAIVRAEVAPLLNAEGRPEGAIILLHDLSHLKSAEQAFDGGEGSLRLSSAGLAHEVKNPLTGIKGASELLAAMFPADLRAQQYCRLILDGVDRIATLVEQVLTASSPQRLKRGPVNIHQVLHQALRMAGLYPETPAGLTIQQAFDPSLPEVTGDAHALERVFLNLLRNAFEAIEAAGHQSAAGGTGTQGGGVRHIIRLRTAIEAKFRVTAHGRRRQFLRVEISDTGKGIAPEELRQLFTPFFTTKPSGTGLGLVLSQRIVALHGGKLWAERGGVVPMTLSREQVAALDDGMATAAAIRDGDNGAGTAVIATKGDGDMVAPGMTFGVMLPVGPD
ncbi:MAG: two-component system sensor histidine kinase NtrB [Candidatus Binataceae bacterium]